MYHDLNDNSSTRYPYYFSHGLTQCGLGSRQKKQIYLTFFLLLLFCGSWMAYENTHELRSKNSFHLGKTHLYQGLRERLLEREYVFREISSYKTGLSEVQERELTHIVEEFSREYGLDPYLTLAVIRTESFFYNRAVSVAGAEGLMQILPPTGADLARELKIPYKKGTLFHAPTNILMGTRYLSQMLKVFNGDMELALIAYNRGPNSLKRSLNQGREVPRVYAEQVFLNYKRLLEKRDRELPFLKGNIPEFHRKGNDALIASK